MTETLLSPPAPNHGVQSHESDSGRDRRVLLLGGLAVVALAAIAVYFLVLHKSSAAPAASSVLGRVPASAPASTKPSSSAKLATIPATYNQAVGRDPFAPLYTPPAAAPSAPSTVSTANSTSGAAVPVTSTSTAPVTSTSTAPTTTSTSTAPTTTSTTAAVTPAWIEMTGQNGTRYASFLVGYTNGTTTPFANVPAPAPYHQTYFGNDFALDQIDLQSCYVQEGDGAPFVLKLGANNRHNFS